MKLKKLYSSREVAQLTGLTARQLQWWDKRKLFPPAVPAHKTASGGFTERRYTPIELLELMVLADLRRKGRELIDKIEREKVIPHLYWWGGAVAADAEAIIAGAGHRTASEAVDDGVVPSSNGSCAAWSNRERCDGKKTVARTRRNAKTKSRSATTA